MAAGGAAPTDTGCAAGPDGLIYVLTEEDDAALLRIEPVEDAPEAVDVPPDEHRPAETGSVDG